jgi:hypothetical protein
MRLLLYTLPRDRHDINNLDIVKVNEANKHCYVDVLLFPSKRLGRDLGGAGIACLEVSLEIEEVLTRDGLFATLAICSSI